MINNFIGKLNEAVFERIVNFPRKNNSLYAFASNKTTAVAEK